MTPELKEQLLVQAELFYTRAASIEPVAKDPMYVQAVAWRLDSLIMMGKIKRRLNRPAAVRSNPLFRCFFFFFLLGACVLKDSARRTTWRRSRRQWNTTSRFRRPATRSHRRVTLSHSTTCTLPASASSLLLPQTRYVTRTFFLFPAEIEISVALMLF